ncbi:paired amphipathic helix protein Sin3a isoform X2 [Copidosoma floridanum]|uniref:paired amphipathic helix protein Sin3a isoform X2 n=1 Tax=Copidosoma floridanum TaxID=29053 RepID=UPI000C6F6FB0|nr:paired amphipathic helix protein Sin3a isoform X2 [Copidosoma floridanum]
MKRVRGVEDISPPVTAAAPLRNSNSAGGAVVGGSAGGGGGGAGPSACGGSSAGSISGVAGGGSSSSLSIEYRSSTSPNIGVVTGGQQPVRTVPPPVPASQEMPSSIQFTQTQQQYPGTIVVPSVAPSPVKSSGPIGSISSSSCATSSIASNVTLHSASIGGAGNHSTGIGGSGGNHSAVLQTSVPSSQAQTHVQTSTIRHRTTVQAPTPPVGNLSNSGPGVGPVSGVVGGGASGTVVGMVSGSQSASGVTSSATNSQFQRLKVEDALSYLDQVKYKFNDQPQVYNDFLDIMKEFKSQSIDTPGVISRVSHLFKGHPELIVGFNTFLPPGYKIEVQANEQGYALQVSVSVPSPTATHTTTLSQHHCTVNVGSPPVPNAPTQSAKPQPTLQIMQGSGSIHHPITNNIVNNHLTVHGPASPPIPYNNSHITQAQAQAVSQALSQAQDGIPTTGQTQQNQPVEFNHAINYVNKIKNRFQDQPDKYKRFLEILHTYQKEQRTLKESGHMGGSGSGGSILSSGKHLTEAEVYSQVAKLFENQVDLLQEFGQFLPDATNQQNALSAVFQTNKVGPVNDHATIVKKPLGIKTTFNNASVVPRDSLRDVQGLGGLERDVRDHRERERERERGPTGIRSELAAAAAQKFAHNAGPLKRSPSFTTSMSTSNSHPLHGPHGPPPPKKHKVTTVKDLSVADVGKHGTLNDYAFFDKVRKALKSSEVYDNFLRCLVLFNQEIISKTELVQLTTPFLGRFPELFRWFKEFLGHMQESSISPSTTDTNQNNAGPVASSISIEALPNNVVRSHQERPQGDLAMEIDYTTCKRLGASYCALPKTYTQPKCSGRTPLCREVLNDTWVSFPTWSEDSTFVTSRKTQFEEIIYRCEDERFELDGVIETNAATIRVLEGVHKKLNRMSSEELQKFKLDDCLGGNSPTIHQRALRRIYGDKAADIIEGLKKNPAVAVSIVLRRLKCKEEEWREAQKGFNKVWREQNEKYYLKSLDHQGINFKQSDVKALRSRSILNEIKVLYDERREQSDENGDNQNSGPHLILPYKDKSVLDDAANLLIHHVKRQTAIHKEDKQRIKTLLKHFIPDLFFHPRQELSDDEQDEDSENVNPALCSNAQSTTTTSISGLQGNRSKVTGSPTSSSVTIKSDPDVKPPPHALSTDPEEAYSLLMGSYYWYLFLRLHQILCERLTKMYERATVLAEEESQYKQQRIESTAAALRLKPKCDIEVEEYYSAFLDMVKNVLDGNMESNVYEDTLREMFGIHAYISFTLDKVVTCAVRQLQHLVSDSVCLQCMEMFQREQKQPKESCGAGGLCSTAYLRAAYEAAYLRKAEKLMAEENCFKIYIYKKDCKMTIELLNSESEETAEGNCRDRDRDSVTTTEKWSSYVERYSSSVPDQQSPKDIPTSSDNEPPANHPVSSDQVARGGRGRKRKNTDINKKIDGNGWGSMEKALAGRKRLYLYRNSRHYKKLAALKSSKESAGAANSEKMTDTDGKKSYGVKSTDESDLVLSDETQCVFNNYQITFIVEKNAYLYKKGCFTQAKQSHRKVTKDKCSKFQEWHFKWASKNIVDSQHRLCQDWLMGRYENLVPHRTRVITDNDQARTPYRQYNRYSIDRLQSEQSAEQARPAD